MSTDELITREEVTKALHLGEAISEQDAQIIRDVMKSVGAELGTIADALRPFMQQMTVTADDITSLHKVLFPNTDGEPRAMNTKKKYPTSTPPWARRRK